MDTRVGYRVFYHSGDEVDIKTRARKGHLTIDDSTVLITGSEQLRIPLADLRSVELFRMYGLGRMLRIKHATGQLFVTVIRFSIGDLFAVVNFKATGVLRDRLTAAIGPHT